ncbi:hypothetical protein QBC37DRAFT_405450 [Rhypophila decipiens]|uniref:Uncharacterized protein n=1 Tax=Rhypophila decipiens TaxID=261697 RepID=A0AAN6XX28_9PEZI|nr:hypothetical protein QBC37DRAFT_405450 [Rhypophila decipiens]
MIMNLYHQRVVRLIPRGVPMRFVPIPPVPECGQNVKTIAAITGNFPVEAGQPQQPNRMSFHISRPDVVCVQAHWELIKEQTRAHVQEFCESICEALKGVKNLAIEWEPWMRIDLELHGPSGLARGVIGSYSPQWDDLSRLSPDENATRSPIAHLIRAAQLWQEHGNRYPIDKAGVRIFWFLDRSIRRDHQWKAAANSDGGKTDPNKQRIIFHGIGIKLTEVRIGDEGWIAPSLDSSHTCPVPDLLQNYTTPLNPGCGAHCGLRRMARRISWKSHSPRVSPATALEKLQTGPVRVLAVEYGNF